MDTKESWGWQLQGIGYSMLTICVLSTALRCYVRSPLAMKAFGLDDWLMLLATAFFAVFTGGAMASVHYGLARHEADLTAEQISTARLFWFVCEMTYGPAITFSRISVGILLLRLTIDRTQRHLILMVIVSSAIAGVPYVLLFTLQCRPLSYRWNTEQDGSCIDQNITVYMAYVSSVVGLVCDSYFAIFPMFLVRGLAMDRSTKIALRVILGLGCIPSIAIIVRFPFLHYLAEPDFLWNAPKSGIWSFVEPALAITAGNLALVRPVLRKLLRALGIQTLLKATKPAPPSQDFPPTIGASKRKVSNPDDLVLLTDPRVSLSSDDQKGTNYTLTLTESSAPISVRKTSAGSENEGEKEVHATVTTDITHGGPETTPKSFTDDKSAV